MTMPKIATRRLFNASLLTALGIAVMACGGSDDNEGPADASTKVDSSVTTQDSGSTPPVGATCAEKVYSELSDECKTCTCGVDPEVAPSCQKPCWDFLACSFVARSGKCAESAAGGAAMRPQFEACIEKECGVQLAVPGAQVASGYSPIVAACASPMGSTPGACTADIGKFAAGLAK